MYKNVVFELNFQKLKIEKLPLDSQDFRPKFVLDVYVLWVMDLQEHQQCNNNKKEFGVPIL